MTAVNFIETPKIHLKPIKALVKKQEILESHRLNYTIISFLNREVADGLETFYEKGIISNRNMKYFMKILNGDADYFFKLGETYNQSNLMTEDFIRVQNLFYYLSEKSLSTFQKNVPLLFQILTTIYELEFIKIITPLLLASLGRVSNESIIRIVVEKQEELKEAFMRIYVNYSNKKEFNFSQFNSLFHKIRKMNYKEFTELTENSLV